jgi:hypothetical protein
MKINIQNSSNTLTPHTDSYNLQYDSLSEIYNLIQSYQEEKAKLFQQYLKLSELIKNENQRNNRQTLEEAQNMVWEKHLYFDHMIKRCFVETTRRVLKSYYGTKARSTANRSVNSSNKKSRPVNIGLLFKKLYHNIISSYL